MGQKLERVIPTMVAIVCAAVFSSSLAGAQGAPVSLQGAAGRSVQSGENGFGQRWPFGGRAGHSACLSVGRNSWRALFRHQCSFDQI